MVIGRRLGMMALAAGIAGAGLVAVPHQAKAWWDGGWHRGWRVGIGVALPPVVVAPPIYAPPPVVYAPPPPVYYTPPPPRVWIPAHWEGGYWVPGHWS